MMAEKSRNMQNTAYAVGTAIIYHSWYLKTRLVKDALTNSMEQRPS
jgi:hypothetical protein